MNNKSNEIETVGDLIAALQRFDATLPVRCVGCEVEYGEACLFYMKAAPIRKCYSLDDLVDLDEELKEGDEYIEL